MWDSGVLVGVDPGGYEAALEYAAADAVLRGSHLHLLHVARPAGWWAGPSAETLVGHAEDRDRDRHLLTEAADRARALVLARGPAAVTSVSTELSHGSAVAVLGSLSRRAEVVVLQHHGWGPRGESSSLSVTAGVAAVSAAPVVAVPDRWRAPAAAGRVVVAVGDPLRDGAVLAAAVEEARRRGVCVEAVQVLAARAPEPMLFPGVDVPLTVVRTDAPPAEVLAGLLRPDDVLVVGRHHRRHVVGAVLGRTVRDLLSRAQVPLLVVDPSCRASSSPTHRPPPAVTTSPGA